MKILIIEDEPSLQELMARSLAKEQHVVETASNYAEAESRLADYSYDCVLLDIMLPDGNGLRLLGELKAQDRREAVIIISARDSLEDKIRGLIDNYKNKPTISSGGNNEVLSVSPQPIPVVEGLESFDIRDFV